jgi:glycosyltransferase involved in cell wall biosynthesis
MVPPGDVDALATRICEVLGSPERMERMATRNLEKAQEYRSELLHDRRIQFYRYVRERTETWLSHKP